MEDLYKKIEKEIQEAKGATRHTMDKDTIDYFEGKIDGLEVAMQLLTKHLLK